MHGIQIFNSLSFFERHPELHDTFYNLAIENSFSRFLDHLNVGLAAKIIFLRREARYVQLWIYGEFSNFDGGHFENRPHIDYFVPTDHVLTADSDTGNVSEQNDTTHGGYCEGGGGVHGNHPVLMYY